MSQDDLIQFLEKHGNITMADDIENERLLFRNEDLMWYQNDPERWTAITYIAVDGMDEQALLNAINKSLMVEQITRITGYFSKISGWNKGKQAELKDRNIITNSAYSYA